jgi:cytochrome c2
MWKMAGLAIALSTVLAAGAAAQEGDPEAGEKVYRKCKTCHMLDEGNHRVGPSLYNVFGSTAGTAEDFRYSDAMIESGIVWDAETMDAYVADPKGLVPGTKMTFAGIDDEQDRLDLIAYLMQATQE